MNLFTIAKIRKIVKNMSEEEKREIIECPSVQWLKEKTAEYGIEITDEEAGIAFEYIKNGKFVNYI